MQDGDAAGGGAGGSEEDRPSSISKNILLS